MTLLPDDRILQLLSELKAAYHCFTWESVLWDEHGHRRSPYRTLVLFGLSARTRDALLVDMCRRFFQRFPNDRSLWERREVAAESVADIVRPGQLPIVESMALALSGGVPRDRDGLLRINGVGDKIAECVLPTAGARTRCPWTPTVSGTGAGFRTRKSSADARPVARGPKMRLS